MSDSSRALRTLAIGVVLAILGAGVGLLAGGLFQDPGMVVDLLFGNTRDAAVRQQRSSSVSEEPNSVLVASAIQNDASLPVREVVAPPTADDAASPIPLISRPSEVRPDPKPLQDPTLPSVSAAPPHSPATPTNSSGPVVQVGAFRSVDAAMALAARLRAEGYFVYVSRSDDSKGAWWRVRVRPLPSMTKARSTAVRLKLKEKLPTWLLVEGG